MRNTLLRILVAAFMVVAVVNAMIGIRNHVTWAYLVAFFCALVSIGLVSRGRAAKHPSTLPRPIPPSRRMVTTAQEFRTVHKPSRGGIRRRPSGEARLRRAPRTFFNRR